MQIKMHIIVRMPSLKQIDQLPQLMRQNKCYHRDSLFSISVCYQTVQTMSSTLINKY
jgi:hypothetical protein